MKFPASMEYNKPVPRIQTIVNKKAAVHLASKIGILIKGWLYLFVRLNCLYNVNDILLLVSCINN